MNKGNFLTEEVRLDMIKIFRNLYLRVVLNAERGEERRENKLRTRATSSLYAYPAARRLSKAGRAAIKSAAIKELTLEGIITQGDFLGGTAHEVIFSCAAAQEKAETETREFFKARALKRGRGHIGK